MKVILKSSWDVFGMNVVAWKAKGARVVFMSGDHFAARDENAGYLSEIIL